MKAAIVWTRVQGALLDGLACGLLGAAAGVALGWPRGGALAGAAAGALLAARWTALRAARAIERRTPGLGCALQALLEGQGGALRPQLEAWVAARTGPVALPAAMLRAGLACALLLAARAPRREQPAAAPAPPLAVRIHLEPPVYAALPPNETSETAVRALRGSKATIEVRGERVRWAEEGKPEQPLAGKIELLLDRSRRLRLSAGAAALIVSLEAVPDEPPRVELLEPAADRIATNAPAPLALRASAHDDVGLASLTLHWTLAHGRGEEMKFRSGRVQAEPTAPGEAKGSVSPLALGMKRGDTLVLWAEATDNNAYDGPGRARSEARIVRWEEALVELTGVHAGAALPPPTALLTEREILARTERLVRQGVRGERLRARSQELASDQRSLRVSFGFFLQAEARGEAAGLDVDDKEVGESGDARARRLLAQAVSAMWEAESLLSVNEPAAAVTPERAAVKALDAAFGLVRLALRPGKALDKPVDESRRLFGAQAGLRPRKPSPENRAETRQVASLARLLFLASQRALGEADARSLGDALWALPPALSAAPLAAALYAAAPAERAPRARAAGEALAHWLRPSPIALPPVSPEEPALLALVPAR